MLPCLHKCGQRKQIFTLFCFESATQFTHFCVCSELSLTETNFLYRKGYCFIKKASLRQKFLSEKKIPKKIIFSSQKPVYVQVSVRKTYLWHRKQVSASEKVFCHQQKFLSGKKGSVTEASW